MIPGQIFNPTRGGVSVDCEHGSGVEDEGFNGIQGASPSSGTILCEDVERNNLHGTISGRTLERRWWLDAGGLTL